MGVSFVVVAVVCDLLMLLHFASSDDVFLHDYQLCFAVFVFALCRFI